MNNRKCLTTTKISSIKKRICLWDNIKFLLIVLVVVGHFADQLVNNSNAFKSLYVFIYAFHMPLFIFISGLFFKPKDITSKCLMYISIGFALKITNFLVKYFLGLNPSFSILSDGGIPWFMFAIAIFTLLAYILRKHNKTYILFFSILLACFAGYDKEIGDFLYLSRVIIFFPFYWLGTMIEQNRILEVKEKYNKLLFVFGIIILILWAYLCLVHLDLIYNLRHLFTGRNYFSNVVYQYGPFARLLCYFISIVLSIAIIGIVPNKNMKNITIYGKRTLQVFFWHCPVIYALFTIFDFKVLCKNIYGKLIFLEIAVLIAIFLSNKIFSFPTKQISICSRKKE